MKPKFYLTTPLYYVNDVPHIGHAYTTIAADVLARYKRTKGFEVFFLTGTDEHGQKVFRTAEKEGRNPHEFVDEIVVRFKNAWDKLNISYSDFIRTTDIDHTYVVQAVFEKLLAKGLIYKGEYQGLYCVHDEAYWSENQMPQDLEGRFLCPDCGRPVDLLKEDTYFFKLSAFQEKLLKYYKENPKFIQPSSRHNETVNFVKQGLRDLSITRTAFPWGIPVPSDLRHVVYVWFDALLNYISALDYPDGELFKKYWPADVHIMGKEIVRFHAVIWPAILMALEIDMPKKVFGHGWWTVDGKKMSKSVGNVVDPIALSEQYGVDAFRYFILREVPFGIDGDFSMQSFINRFNADLANDLGNLLSRSLTMIEKYFGGVVPEKPISEEDELSKELVSLIKATPQKVDESLNNLAFSDALENIWSLVITSNAYIEKQTPWALAKQNNTEQLAYVLNNLYEVLKVAAILVNPFMPDTAQNIWRQLNLPHDPAQNTDELLGIKIAGTIVKKGGSLFPRLAK
ncbi:methionine--tRNA ligase [Candidatus Saganbacteria bacterium]|nr:methionine--tRNA ligase [Candidatus Saganbacteria bacterium]